MIEQENQLVSNTVTGEESVRQQVEATPQNVETFEDFEHYDEAEDTIDYASLSKEQVVELSKKLLEEKSFKKINDVLRKLREEIDSRNQEERKDALDAFVQSGGNEDDFEFRQDSFTDSFYENFKKLKERQSKYYEELEKKRQNNVVRKSQIVDQIRTIVDSGTITKEDTEKIKSLQQEWKDAGFTPEAEELYNSYKALLDRFYNQKSMEHELLMLDRQKNIEAKLRICEKAEALLDEQNINEAVSQLNRLHEEYKNVGPVPKDDQEKVWKRFKDASDKLYDKKRAYVEDLKKQLEDNMKIKQQLCLDIEGFTDFQAEKITEWNAKTQEVLELQRKWEEIGAVPREVAKNINKHFWSNFKSFFNNKTKFFEVLESNRTENLQLKEALCVQAEALKDSFEWDETTDKLKTLQEEWKKVGSVPENQRESIYERFKAACDTFFDRKRNRRNDQEKEFKNNLAKKTAICEKIKNLDINNFQEELQQLHEDWFKIGFVPKKDISEVQDDLLDATEALLEKTALEENTKDDLILALQMRVLENNPSNNSKKIAKREQSVRRKIQNLESDISLWKNNLEFFANSKTADKLKEEFNTKIEEASKELDRLRSQLKALQQTRQKARNEE